MGLRRLTDQERKAARFMAASQLWSGEDKRAVRGAVARWLIAKGWLPAPAATRAREVVDACRATPETPGSGTPPTEEGPTT